MDPQDLLLAAIKTRGSNRPDAFWEGIRTADAYAKTIEECVGVGACYKFASTRGTSWTDVMQKAAKTLVYHAPEMELAERGIEFYGTAGSALKKYEGIELPKNTLMVFRHVLTSPRKDRDGDTLRTQGATVDQKMLLLWQHVHTLPIGKLLAVHEHNSKRLEVVSCIVDMNELAHDAAVMIDNGMGRFSHGFRALEYVEMKATEGDPTGPAGFDVKRFEIMEESLVSVPSNVDAQVTELMLDLVEGGKLKSPLLKEQGRALRAKRAVSIPVNIDLKLVLNGKEINDASTITPADDKSAATPGHKCACGGAPEKANDDAAEGAAGDKARSDDEEMTCPECDGKMVDGICEECGYEKAAAPDDKAADEGTKQPKCPECGGMLDKDGNCKCGYKTDAGKDDEKPEDEKQITTTAAMGIVLARATPAERATLRRGLDALDAVDAEHARVAAYKALTGN